MENKVQFGADFVTITNDAKTVIGVIISIIGVYFIIQLLNWLPSTIGSNYGLTFFLNIVGPFLLLLSGLLLIPFARRMFPYFNGFDGNKQAIASIVLFILGLLFIIAIPISYLN